MGTSASTSEDIKIPLTPPAASSSAPSSAPSGDAVISVRGLTKVFKDFWGRPKARAVDKVSFDVKRGEVFGLLGPNGSGKSTTVKLLLGLLYPTQGHIEVFGHSPRHVATKARIGYLPEESYLYRYLDSGETLDFFGSLFTLSSNQRRRRIEQLLEMVGLGQVRRRTIGEFSKGMQRRIGLAQALINDPDLIILDEPTAGLDPIGCREVKDLIVTLARRGKTVLLSSHLLADVEDVCDRVVIYYGGRVHAMGPLKELLATPDALRINTPALPRPTLQRVLDLLRAEVPADLVTVETPTQNLESYFLGVVRQARLTETETSGATSGHQVAAYLRGEAEVAAPADKILERLAQPQAAPAVTITPPPSPTPAIDLQKLAALTQLKPAPPAPAPPAAPDAQPAGSTPEELAQANEKLSNLLRKK